jgi:hypothetical protein
LILAGITYNKLDYTAAAKVTAAAIMTLSSNLPLFVLAVCTAGVAGITTTSALTIRS